jgi:hypothetical protein
MMARVNALFYFYKVALLAVNGAIHPTPYLTKVPYSSSKRFVQAALAAAALVLTEFTAL